MAVHEVSPSSDVQAVCWKLQSGDKMRFTPGEYLNQFIGVRRNINFIELEGIRDNNGNRPRFKSFPVVAGKNTPPTFPQIWSGSFQDKGTCVLFGNDVTITDLEFSGAKSSRSNGAGIRHFGRNMTVKRCYFHDNENGILGSEKDDPLTAQIDEGGLIWLEDNDFEHNGAGADGQAHNFYIGNAEELVVLNNRSKASKYGHTCKGRASSTTVVGNLFEDADGNPSYHCDHDGGFVLLVGNTSIKGPNADNKYKQFNLYIQHEQRVPHEFYALFNYMVSTISLDGSYIFYDDRIYAKINGKVQRTGELGHIDGAIIANVGVYSPAVPKHSYKNFPFHAPANVRVENNLVVPLGQEPTWRPPQFRVTPETLQDFKKLWVGIAKRPVAITLNDPVPTLEDDLMYKEQAELLAKQVKQMGDDLDALQQTVSQVVAERNAATAALDAAVAALSTLKLQLKEEAAKLTDLAD